MSSGLYEVRLVPGAKFMQDDVAAIGIYIQHLVRQVAEKDTEMERLSRPFSDFQRGETIQVNDPSYTGTGTFECEEIHRIGVRLEHGYIRWYPARNVSRAAPRAGRSR